MVSVLKTKQNEYYWESNRKTKEHMVALWEQNLPSGTEPLCFLLVGVGNWWFRDIEW